MLLQHDGEVEVFSVFAEGHDPSSFTVGGSSPLIVSSIGEIIYPAIMKPSKSSLLKSEPGIVVMDLARQTWRKIILPV